MKFCVCISIDPKKELDSNVVLDSSRTTLDPAPWRNRVQRMRGSASQAAVAGLHCVTLAVRLRIEAKLWRAGLSRAVNQLRR